MTKRLRRLLAGGIAALQLISAAACSASLETPVTEGETMQTVENNADPAPTTAPVPDHLTAPPVYTLPGNASSDEARAMAVRAMADQLTFPWTPAQDATLKYIQVNNDRNRTFYASKAYAGMPYAGGGTGLLQALSYYDFETGVMKDLPWQNINDVFGNTCATAVNWALSAVCPSVCGTQTDSVAPAFGYEPIGDVTLPPDLVTFDNGEHSTSVYVDAADEQALYRAYAMMLPADVYISVGSPNEGAHAMMCYETPEIVSLPGGGIDPDNSFAVVIDQRATDKEYVLNGTTYLMRGRIGGRISFSELRRKHYLPLRPADLANWQGSEPAASALDGAVSTLAELRGATVLSNYRLARLTFTLTDESGEVVLTRKLNVAQSNFREKQDRAFAAASAIPGDRALKDAVGEGKT